jgi:hypothetical protein
LVIVMVLYLNKFKVCAIIVTNYQKVNGEIQKYGRILVSRLTDRNESNESISQKEVSRG